MALIRRITSQTITRPSDTTAYADTDLVANSTTAGSVTPFTWDEKGNVAQMKLVSAILNKSKADATNASFRLWLFSDSKAVTNGDNSAIVPTTMDSFLGTLSGSVTFAGTAGARTPMAVDVQTNIWPADGKLYGLLEAKAAYTPASGETFSIELVWALEA